jgi:hypothetical protein
MEFVPLDTECVEDGYRLEHRDSFTAENAWRAIIFMDKAISRPCEEYAAQERITTFGTLKSLLDPINSKALVSYEQAAEKLQVSGGAAKTLIHRFVKAIHLVYARGGRPYGLRACRS